MPNVVQSLRSITPGARPTGKLEGELYVNLPDKQFGMIDETGAPVDLGAVRHFSELASYVIGDHVVQKRMAFHAIAGCLQRHLTKRNGCRSQIASI